MTGSDPLAEAKRLLGRNAAAALAAARRAHETRATPETTLLRATAARRAGDPGAAAELLKPLAGLQAWGVQYELGIALASVGDEAGGIAALERAAALNPRATAPQRALQDLGATKGGAAGAVADPALDDAVADLLDDPGTRDALMGRFGLDRDDVAAACLIADTGLRLGRAEAVAILLERALMLAPRYRPARFRLAEALHRADRDEEALETLAPLDPHVQVLALRGAILLRLGRDEEALEAFTTVALAEPERATSWLAQGHALRALGRRDDAIAAYRQALATDPALAEAWWSIADLKTASFGPDDLAAMAALRAQPDLPVPGRSLVEFALGRACEDGGDYPASFGHYRTANALRRSIEPYDDAAHHAFVDRMIEIADAAFFAAREGQGQPGSGPIFVVGMPRSGSTLVEQILGSHSQVEGLSELPKVTHFARSMPAYPEGLAELWPETLAAMGADYLASTRALQRTDARHVVDKFPGNAFHAALIHLILPDARIIDVRRDARDCCVSLFSQSFAAGQSYSYDLTDLGRHYARYEKLMDHFDRVLPNRILRVRYEALVDDLEAETRRLLDYCGLAFEPATLRFFDRPGAVRTASSEQVRRPIYRSSVGRWQRFAPWLQPLHEGLTAAEI